MRLVVVVATKSTVRWAVCLPLVCEQIEVFKLRSYVSHINIRMLQCCARQSGCIGNDDVYLRVYSMQKINSQRHFWVGSFLCFSFGLTFLSSFRMANESFEKVPVCLQCCAHFPCIWIRLFRFQ